MDAGFASTMKSSVEELKSAFSSFTSGTITEAVWNGDAADNAKNQVTEKIDTKIEEVEAKLDNLISAIGKATEAEELKEKIDSIKSKTFSTTEERDAAQAEQDEYQSQLDALIEEIKGLYS